MPGGLYPRSEVGSGGLGCHDDHSRLLGQPHSRVEQAHEPVLHHPDNGHGATVAKMRLQGTRLLPRKHVREGQVRLGGELLVQGLAAPLLRSGWGVGMGVDSQSIGCDDEDRRLSTSPNTSGTCSSSQSHHQITQIRRPDV